MQLLAHGPSYLATSCKYHQASRPPPCQNSCTWTVGSLTYCIEQSDWDFSEALVQSRFGGAQIATVNAHCSNSFVFGKKCSNFD
jgi:hypothetical protein